MLAIEVEYLLGRAVATDHRARDRAEWPPHPNRLFSALVDAHHANATPATAAVLQWLESLSPPSLSASLDGDVSIRDVGKHWVPVNDELPSTESRLRPAPLSAQRSRQERFFPAVIPSNPCVTFIWPNSEATTEQRRALETLVHRLCYLGHSSSLVRAAILEVAPRPNLVPDVSGQPAIAVLRVPGPGRLRRLNEIHSLRRENETIQPPIGNEVRYFNAAAIPLTSTFALWGRLRIKSGPPIGLEATAPLLGRLRAALLSKLAEPMPESVSGHLVDGGKAVNPHLALVPLSNIANRYADGGVKGFGLLLPANTQVELCERVADAFLSIARLHLGTFGTLELTAHTDDESMKSLHFQNLYMTPSREWQSVTPVVLGRHAKPRRGYDEQSIVREEVLRAGLPAPTEILLSHVSAVAGAPLASAFSRERVTHLQGRAMRHVSLRFEHEIAGPVLVGAGRFFGLGLFLPKRAR